MTASPTTQHDESRLRAAFRWMFASRVTGKITIAELPNVPLAIFLVAAGLQRLFHPRHALGSAVALVGSAALVWWSLAEIFRGVNPFRRILGVVVLVAMVLALAMR